jgi:hypothetical protein
LEDSTFRMVETKVYPVQTNITLTCQDQKLGFFLKIDTTFQQGLSRDTYHALIEKVLKHMY